MAEAFSFRLAERLRKALSKCKVKYLFLGKSGAIILGYPDTTQDADIFVEKNPQIDLDDIIRSNRETLPRLRAFRDYWKKTKNL